MKELLKLWKEELKPMLGRFQQSELDKRCVDSANDVDIAIDSFQIAMDHETMDYDYPYAVPTQKEVQALIQSECDSIAEMLIGKNESYGNSALEPINVFSDLPAVDQIKVRIDDKLNRLQKGSEFQGDDTELDLIGYLILLRIAKGLRPKPEPEPKKLTGGGRLAV